MSARRGPRAAPLAHALLCGALPWGALLCGALLAAVGDAAAQEPEPRAPRPPSPFYDTATPLAITLTANHDRLRRDRDDEAPWRAAVLTYATDSTTAADPAGAAGIVSIPLRVRTRGFWRLRNCDFPPLRLNFWHDSTAGTLLAGVDRPKLVVHCRNTTTYDEYVLQELQAYRIHALLTPYAHRARLVRATYADSGSGRERATRWAIMLEEPEALADRVGGRHVEQKGAGPNDVDPYQHAVHSLFQYMIGNTDWSIAALHNVELYFKDSVYVPVAYDFDHSGLVNTEYALPPPQLRLRSVRDRRWRGYCVGAEQLPAVFDLFRARKEAIYALYHDEIGQLMRKRTVETALDYLDSFYRRLDDPAELQREIADRCLGSTGTP